MLVKTRGIIFKTLKYGETSLIVDVYTEQLGLQKYIVNGVRSRKARVQASLMQVMSLVDLVAYTRPDRDLHRLREVRSAYVYHSIPFDIRKGAVGLFMAEVARKTIRESEENRLLFDFLLETFQYLDQTNNPVGNLHLYFMLALSTFLGFLPSGMYSAETPYFDLQEGVFLEKPPDHPYFTTGDESRLLSALLNATLANCHEVEMTTPHRRALLRRLLDFYRLQIENFPPIHAHQILQEVLEG